MSKNFKNELFSVVPFIILMVSSGLTGIGLYMENHAGWGDMAIYISIAITAVGLILAAVFSALNQWIERIKYKWFPLIITLIFMALWLFFSPVYNAMTVTARQAIQAEIVDQTKIITEYANPYITRDKYFTNNVMPDLYNTLEKLKKQKNFQSLPQNGGCGPICKQLGTIIDNITPRIERLSQMYPSGKRKNVSTSILKELRGLNRLTTDDSLKPIELLQKYNKKKGKIASYLQNIGQRQNPVDITQEINDNLKELKRYLLAQDQSKNYVSEPLRIITPQTKLLDDILKNSQDIKSSMSKDMPVFSGIVLNSTLVWKHKDQYMPLMILAFIIDILGFTLILIGIIDKMLETQEMRDKRKKELEDIKNKEIKAEELKIKKAQEREQKKKETIEKKRREEERKKRIKKLKDESQRQQYEIKLDLEKWEKEIDELEEELRILNNDNSKFDSEILRYEKRKEEYQLKQTEEIHNSQITLNEKIKKLKKEILEVNEEYDNNIQKLQKDYDNKYLNHTSEEEKVILETDHKLRIANLGIAHNNRIKSIEHEIQIEKEFALNEEDQINKKYNNFFEDIEQNIIEENLEKEERRKMVKELISDYENTIDDLENELHHIIKEEPFLEVKDD